jgi:hypothetical protein
MADKLTARKLINDLTGKNTLTTRYFDEKWMEENSIDVAAARLQTQKARELRDQFVNAQNAPQLLMELQMVQEQPEEDEGDGREDVEEIPGRGPWA